MDSQNKPYGQFGVQDDFAYILCLSKNGPFWEWKRIYPGPAAKKIPPLPLSNGRLCFPVSAPNTPKWRRVFYQSSVQSGSPDQKLYSLDFSTTNIMIECVW